MVPLDAPDGGVWEDLQGRGTSRALDRGVGLRPPSLPGRGRRDRPGAPGLSVGQSERPLEERSGLLVSDPWGQQKWGVRKGGWEEKGVLEQQGAAHRS